ncbi:hypothetical protein TraAM80_10264 [Trypanosoma rangeli]|uniref:Uncharacterized protein n=1 Tax=Trypanosoma rangeli TaxID=5698 RepID=A0A422MQK5_TRYRA|nr:uncharacterized protein TraAM80_10264 [Trypanosoma rangeli]RNE95487.1 hypothetical protein TraAM80_10264 [Trypanosoma rangeli]|eukprot:RNE95487.1 hypothetical protein TraAM80_10264 [Trypanosoma rangeli]
MAVADVALPLPVAGAPSLPSTTSWGVGSGQTPVPPQTLRLSAFGFSAPAAAVTACNLLCRSLPSWPARSMVNATVSSAFPSQLVMQLCDAQINSAAAQTVSLRPPVAPHDFTSEPTTAHPDSSHQQQRGFGCATQHDLRHPTHTQPTRCSHALKTSNCLHSPAHKQPPPPASHCTPLKAVQPPASPRTHTAAAAANTRHPTRTPTPPATRPHTGSGHASIE